MSLKLRDLIRQVRACKTAAEERSVIARESAMIRTCIRDEKDQYRHRNVAKLLFMHMLGYPTHFGQLECLKLIASPHFPEKRIGYLGLLLLLSEEADVLMLATNSLKNDLNNSNRFIAGLALCTIGNLATADMSRDLVTEVEKHLKSSYPYLRKKACLAMSRCLIKVPEMVEDFTEKFVTLLKDRSHGVLVTIVQLMTQVMLLESSQEEYDEANYGPARIAFAKLVPTLVKMLRSLLTSGYNPEYDVGGITDPFLQVQILTLLRLLGKNDQETSDEMNDVLAQVATNTETSKNAGNAILYECVQTIMTVESEDSLRTLAVNILGRFLLNRDNNIRYVALNTLAHVVGQDSTAVQRHRSTIVDCLKDPDVSIRQRALELIYHLVNNENVETLTAELLNYLVVCPQEHRGEICTRVLKVVDRFSPEDRWRVDTLITMLTIAGKECNQKVQSASIVYISRSAEHIRAYSTHKLLKAIRDDDGTQTGLLVVGIWCIGEYGDMLLQPHTYTIPAKTDDEGNITSEEITITCEAMDAEMVVDTVQKAVKDARPFSTESVTQRALTCYAKLSERFANIPEVSSRLEQLVKKHKGSQSVETQLRSCEYGALMGLSGKAETLARMPVVELEVLYRRQKLHAVEENGAASPQKEGAISSNGFAPAAAAAANNNASSLLDLDDIFGSAPAAAAATPSAVPVAQENGNDQMRIAAEPKASLQSDVDLLSDIFSAPPASVAPPSNFGMGLTSTTAQPQPDLFSSQPVQMPQPSAAAAAPVDLFGQPTVTSAAPSPALGMTNMAPSAASLDPFAAVPAAPTPAPISNSNNGFMNAMPAAVPEPSKDVVSVLDKDGLQLEFECSKLNDGGQSEVVAKFTNKAGTPIHGMNLQCAVPKYVTMEMQPPSSTSIPLGPNKVTQKIKVTNNMLGKKNLMMKVKLSFTVNGQKFEHMSTCSSFPSGY